MKNLDEYNEYFSKLNQEDKAFALKVIQEYDVPVDWLCVFIANIRNATLGHLENGWEVDPSGTLSFSEMRDIKQKIRDSASILDEKVKEISITTSKGIVKVNPSDYVFSLFHLPIYKLKKEYEKYLTSDLVISKEMTINGSLSLLYSCLITKSSLKKSHRYEIIGMFLVHFKLYPGKPLLTKPEYDPGIREADTYKRYLYNIVKSRMKKIIK